MSNPRPAPVTDHAPIQIRKMIRKKRTRHKHLNIELDDAAKLTKLLASKIMEEAAELAQAIIQDDEHEVLAELADVREIMRLVTAAFGYVDVNVRIAGTKKSEAAGPLVFQYIERPARVGYKVVDLGHGIVFEVKNIKGVSNAGARPKKPVPAKQK